MHYKKENGQYNIDFGKFHNVYDVNTPSYSAKEIDDLRVGEQGISMEVRSFLTQMRLVVL